MDNGLDYLAQSARLAIENGAAYSAPAAPSSAPVQPRPPQLAQALRERMAGLRRSSNIIDLMKKQ